MNMPTPMATSSMARKVLADSKLYWVLPCFRPPTMAARPRMPLMSNITAANTVSRARGGLGAPRRSTTTITPPPRRGGGGGLRRAVRSAKPPPHPLGVRGEAERHADDCGEDHQQQAPQH